MSETHEEWLAQPNTCHCVGLTVAPMGVHAKYSPGCVFNEVRRVTRHGNCRCGQVFASNGAGIVPVPHKPGVSQQCWWYGRLSELDDLEVWAMGATVERPLHDLAVDRTFENEFRMNRP